MGSLSPVEVENVKGFLRLHSDGTVIRLEPTFDIPVHDDASIHWKDVEFEPNFELSLRLYKPASSFSSTKLPVVIYFHAGGYCFGSRTWLQSHNYCLRLAKELQAVVLSPDHRLAPENRLPAAIEDGLTALKWLRSCAVREVAEKWVEDVDFERVFILGDSSGGNLAHHLAVRLGAGSPEMKPMRVGGYVLLSPFFGGTVRTRSEEMCPNDAFYNMDVNDKFWRLSLPVGANADHPLSNPFGLQSPNLESMALDPLLVVACGEDLLLDRVEEYAKKLKSWGKEVEFAKFEAKGHGFHTMDFFSKAADELMCLIKRFMAESTIRS
ncbi:carboxylesterase 15 [Aristolochia californica]|uniref:carboxylesterase 15 n=1 Tax=Aristolochia californica TaxID=171875 RepID=UPI0035D9091F